MRVTGGRAIRHSLRCGDRAARRFADRLAVVRRFIGQRIEIMDGQPDRTFARDQPLEIVEPRFEVLTSEEHTSELQSLMRIPSAVLCWKKKTTKTKYHTP